MYIKNSVLLLAAILISSTSCEKDDINPELGKFCNGKPYGWDCEIIQRDFDSSDIPENAGNPLAIIKYRNPFKEFAAYVGTKVNPSLTLDFYSIEQKNELIDFIDSQQMYSWCIPIFFGETKDYFIMSSPCFINSGSFTEESDSCISDLYDFLGGLMTIN